MGDFGWGENRRASFCNGDAGLLLTLLADSGRLCLVELACDWALFGRDEGAGDSSSRSSGLMAADWRERGLSVRPAANVVVAVLTLRWPTLGAGLAMLLRPRDLLLTA